MLSIDDTISFEHIVYPTSWPKPPAWMSFSILVELEACPLGWSLTNAKYRDLGLNNGYPLLPSLPALEGITVHQSLSNIVYSLSLQKCNSVTSEELANVLRKMGGLTEVINNNLQKVLGQHIDNPRLKPFLALS